MPNWTGARDCHMATGLRRRGEKCVAALSAGTGFHRGVLGLSIRGRSRRASYPPKLNRSPSRLPAVVADADASIALTSERLLNRLDSFFDAAESLRRVRWVATEQIADSMAGTWRPADVEADTLAFLQYTSGSYPFTTTWRKHLAIL